MVTAELAAVLPAIVFVLAVALNAVAIGIDQIRCVDAARMAARSASRGDSPAQISDIGRRAAPGGATVLLRPVADAVEVTVSTQPPGPFGWLIGNHRLSGSVIAPLERSP
ncbi:TadE family type IV pilus minor pilin [Branchiibius cervicis]|uniref:TadE family type IV pilus minor pilin n=1 Tax=Branchiibius cervicis TaxID=908252 RepID=A0ABW2APM0_9MICO